MHESANDIIVGIDGSTSAVAAARWAAIRAVAFDAPLRLVHAQVPGAAPAAPDPLTAAVDEVRAATPEARVSVCAHPGTAADLLISESAHARLVVLGSSGMSDGPENQPGSVAIAVSSHARCPVVVVRGSISGQPLSEAGPIVVGVEESRFSDAALALAVEFARSGEAPVIAVHAWTDLGIDHGEWRALPGGVDEIQARELRDLTSRLAPWRTKFPDVTIHERVVHDRPVRGLLTAARPHEGVPAQLLVVGSRGQAAPRGMGLGSTSHALLHYAECPVAVARPEQTHVR